jgi:hypothetical protein
MPLEQTIDAFEDAWQRGDSPAIDPFLPLGAAERQACLIDLVHIDVEYRLRLNSPCACAGALLSLPTNTSNGFLNSRQNWNPSFENSSVLSWRPRWRGTNNWVAILLSREMASRIQPIQFRRSPATGSCILMPEAV